MPGRIVLSHFGLLAVGLGSAAFHGTLLYEAQLMDELPMVSKYVCHQSSNHPTVSCFVSSNQSIKLIEPKSASQPINPSVNQLVNQSIRQLILLFCYYSGILVLVSQQIAKTVSFMQCSSQD
jgi:hypothetical protein